MGVFPFPGVMGEIQNLILGSVVSSGVYAKQPNQTPEQYETSLSNYYNTELPDEFSEGRYKHQSEYAWSEHIKYPFGIAAAKLLMAVRGHNVEDYAQIETIGGNPPLFKLNLYPIAFRNDDPNLWIEHELPTITGIESKEAYRAWCFLNRFPTIAEYVTQYSPRLIIGTGVSYLVGFFACFAGNRGSENIHVGELEPTSSANSTPRRYYWSLINQRKTLLVVVPFFSGRYGLNSNYLIEQLGLRLANLQAGHDAA